MKRQSRLGVIIVYLVVLVVGLIGGMFLLDGFIMKDDLEVSKTQCEYEDKDICKFMENFTKSKIYSVIITTNGHDGESKILIEASDDDSIHNVVWVNGGETFEAISIGNVTYTKDYSDNKWLKQALIPTTDFKVELENGVKTAILSDQYEKIGKEQCGELTCFKYELTATEDERVVQYIWFDDREYLVRKMRKEEPAMIAELEYSYDTAKIVLPLSVK